MREGSSDEIRHGQRVVGRNGDIIGGVDEVIVDQESGIFIGLSVKPDLFTHSVFVPGQLVHRLHEGIVYIDAELEELKPYETPEERRSDTREAFEQAERAA